MNFHEAIDWRAAQAQEELRKISQRYQDEITIKAGFWIRSNAQKRRFQNARISQEKNTK